MRRLLSQRPLHIYYLRLIPLARFVKNSGTNSQTFSEQQHNTRAYVTISILDMKGRLNEP